jgi:hypothetical protein
MIQKVFPIQAAIRGGKLHIQGRCTTNLNRHYGFAADITVPKEFVDWLLAQNGNKRSMASDKTDYLEGAVYMNGSDRPALLFAGTQLNHENGARLKVKNDPHDLLRRFTQVAKPIVVTDAVLDAGDGSDVNAVLA